ncbi:hypothetical protein AZE42_12277 [Rhizopogon vesiculosus]|uniref:Uncharacterized protein n=1 Tax=Rhizopogon vesiculosus TaxID=180088 RepID=A0A1J8PIG3_9AGAM|nr:hypothetical protein AZE42_12277 [Rhizopogon vesiculosus]
MLRTFFAPQPKFFVKRHFQILIPNPHLRTITQISRHLAYPLATVLITPLPPPPPLASPSSLEVNVEGDERYPWKNMMDVSSSTATGGESRAAFYAATGRPAADWSFLSVQEYSG